MSGDLVPRLVYSVGRIATIGDDEPKYLRSPVSDGVGGKSICCLRDLVVRERRGDRKPGRHERVSIQLLVSIIDRATAASQYSAVKSYFQTRNGVLLHQQFLRQRCRTGESTVNARWSEVSLELPRNAVRHP